MRKHFSLRKNKKGFTLVELICVVSLMGILAVVIGALLTSASTAYMREKEATSAKDIGTIIENEIARCIKNSSKVCLTGSNDNFVLATPELPTATYWKATDYTFTNNMFANYSECSMFYARYADSGSDRETRGYLRYIEKGASGVSDWRDATDYFAGDSTAADGYDKSVRNAFYGSYKINLSFKAVFDAADLPIGVYVICDVYNSKNQLKYDSPGTIVNFLKAIDTTQKFDICGEIQYANSDSESDLINSPNFTITNASTKQISYYDFTDKTQTDVNGNKVLNKDKVYSAIYFA